MLLTLCTLVCMIRRCDDGVAPFLRPGGVTPLARGAFLVFAHKAGISQSLVLLIVCTLVCMIWRSDGGVTKVLPAIATFGVLERDRWSLKAACAWRFLSFTSKICEFIGLHVFYCLQLGLLNLEF